MRAKPDLDFDTLYVFGAGGHGQEISWIAKDAWSGVPDIVFVVDDERHHPGVPIGGHSVMLLDELQFDADSRYVVGVGDGSVRRRVANTLDLKGGSPATIVHASVQHSESVSLAPGAVVFPGVVLTTNVTVGRHAHLNTACTVSHDSTIGDYSTLSPGVHIAGRVEVGCGVFIGIGASIINGLPGHPLTVGDDATIAAGACVIGPVEGGALVAGVPAVRKK